MKRLTTIKALIAAASSAFLMGCVDPRVAAGVGQVRQLGADLNDNALETAEFTVCYGASIGSIRRKYGGSEESQQVWEDFCKQAMTGEISPPPVN